MSERNWLEGIEREAEIVRRAEERGAYQDPAELDRRDPVAYGGALWQEDPHNIFIPVSERLRLHYCEGAHAGLRGDWARVIREETAMRRASVRTWRRALRDQVTESDRRLIEEHTTEWKLARILAFVRDLTDEHFSLLAQERGYFLVIPDQEDIPF